MKTLIRALVLVMGCGEAIAETPMRGGGGGGGWERLPEVGWPNDNTLGYLDPCLAIMEKAMRAMDPFVDWRFLFGLAHKQPEETTEQEKIDAFKKWEKAKAQCWSNY